MEYEDLENILCKCKTAQGRAHMLILAKLYFVIVEDRALITEDQWYSALEEVNSWLENQSNTNQGPATWQS